MSRWLALALALLLIGCGAMSRNRQRAPTASMPDESSAGAQRVRGRAPDGSGIYLASFIAVGVEVAGGVAVVAGFDVNTIPFGTPRIGVVNRWNGAVGQHTDETRLLDRDGVSVASDSSKLTGERVSGLIDPDLSQTVADVLDISRLQPGAYDVVVTLDGREYARYAIRIIAVEGQRGGGNRDAQ